MKLEDIPRAVVLRYRKMLSGHLDLEDLESVANVALAEALLRFDPAKSHQGEGGLVPFVGQAVRLILLAHIKHRGCGRPSWERANVRAYLSDVVRKADGVKGRTELVELVGREDSGPRNLENAEEFGRMLRILPQNYREVVEDHLVRGLTLEEIAGARGVSKQRVGQIWRKAAEKLKGHYYPSGDPRMAQ